MRAGKVVKGLGMAAVALTLVSACMVGSTLAKYTTSLTGSGSAVVAKWAPKFTSGDAAFTNSTVVSLKDTTIGTNKLTADKIAPGTDGSFSIVVEHDSGSDVAFHYTITMTNKQGMPTNLKFYSDAGFTTEITTDELVSADLMLGDGAATATVYWKWATGTTAEDAADTANGVAAGEGTFDITCTATQIEPVA